MATTPPTNPKPVATNIADSAVGERLPAANAAGYPAQGAIDPVVPDLAFLDPHATRAIDMSVLERDAAARARVIDLTLSHFGLQAKVVDYARGPTVTRFEVEPAPGEKIARIQSLQNDLARALAVGGVRIEAPIPGKSVIGLEVPNTEREPVTFRTGVESNNYRQGQQKLPLLLGKSIDGELLVGDLAKMPHLLIAGSTGSGKSVCVNTLIMSLLFRYLPDHLRFIMIDPKMVELTPYDGIPHLVRPVVTNPSDAAGVLLGCVAHMERRYKMMSQVGAKNLEQYNTKARHMGEPELPYLVIIIDELADLMITSPKEVEAAIMRLAQMARATGMHLVLATQRPSVDILTSLIKVNVPARIAFAVSSGHDSRTILDTAGAERLTGYGDMLFYQPGLVKPVRLQGPYISETELSRVTEFLCRQVFEDGFGEAYGTDFDAVLETSSNSRAENMDFSDPLLRQAAEVVIEEGYAAVSRLQRRLSVGHARAGKLIDILEAMGIIGPYKGSKSREVLIHASQLVEFFG
jgi:DNA segregation ATPase FtsK/SpoIIIE, S-DNA-T family